MDKLLLENHALINKIKNEYDRILEENKLLKEKIDKIDKIDKGIDLKSKVNFYDTNIPKNIVYRYGKGPIRYFENGLYYHGLGINDTQTFNVNNKFDKCYFVYNKVRSIPHKNIATHDKDSFCSKCSYNDELNKGRSRVKIVNCLGHKNIC